MTVGGEQGEVARTGRVTLSQVARAAGVSTTTASFVLAGRKDGQRPASDQTAARVMQAARDLGYAANAHARAMRRGRTDSVALALGDPRDPWANELAHVVSLHASGRGLSTLVLADDSWPTLLQGHQFDCALVTGAEYHEHGHDQVRELARQGNRLVVHSAELEPAGFDVIRSAATTAVGEAHALLRSRHERVHYLGAVQAATPVRSPSRRDLFLQAVTEAGDDPRGAVVRVAPTLGAAQSAATEWLHRPGRPTAVVTQTGYLAIALQAAALRVGVRVPDDLEIIALGDVPEATSLFGPVSHFAPDDGFTQIADALVVRAVTPPDDLPWRLVDLAWVLQPGLTTR
ncbi:LacI family DNA-binding transcriptional regulator [Aestuariimicrobium kwangyangense]|uniref:LacI family DNA-binding transcriptional regulator n=1 Tax=Aestuariimicrobium kwangyangense TaxID=396389 RepID=UPI0003B46060|nr:LacI family DNA-binding transcriptional regulator [Aestuariimicrobium kwangyangense]